MVLYTYLGTPGKGIPKFLITIQLLKNFGQIASRRHPERSEGSQLEVLCFDQDFQIWAIQPSHKASADLASIILPLRGIHFWAKKNTSIFTLDNVQSPNTVGVPSNQPNLAYTRAKLN